MVGGVVDEMAKHLAEGVHVFAAGGRLYQPRVVEPVLAQPGHEVPPLRLHRLPARAHLGQGFEVGTLRDGGIRSLQPAMQPQLLRPPDVAERAVNPAVAALQVAEVLVVGQPGDRLEDRAVRPAVVRKKIEKLVHQRAAAVSPASMTESVMSLPSIVSLSPITDPRTLAFCTWTPLPRILLAMVLPTILLPNSIDAFGPIVD